MPNRFTTCLKCGKSYDVKMAEDFGRVTTCVYADCPQIKNSLRSKRDDDDDAQFGNTVNNAFGSLSMSGFASIPSAPAPEPEPFTGGGGSMDGGGASGSFDSGSSSDSGSTE